MRNEIFIPTKREMRVMKIFDMKQANKFIQYGAHVLSVNIDKVSGKFYVKFEADHYFQELMIKWQNKEI